MYREADFQSHTLTYAIGLTRERGRITQLGDFQSFDRCVSVYDMRNKGVYLHPFIKELKQHL